MQDDRDRQAGGRTVDGGDDGLRTAQQELVPSCSVGRAAGASPSGTWPASALTSAPAQNPRPAPVRMMPTTSTSAVASRTASRTSWPMMAVHALSWAGRFT